MCPYLDICPYVYVKQRGVCPFQATLQNLAVCSRPHADGKQTSFVSVERRKAQTRWPEGYVQNATALSVPDDLDPETAAFLFEKA